MSGVHALSLCLYAVSFVQSFTNLGLISFLVIICLFNVFMPGCISHIPYICIGIAFHKKSVQLTN